MAKEHRNPACINAVALASQELAYLLP
eukprot:SM003159S11884  [mRNA]  locus=s3159:825:905:+ [translate_table: standard]